MRENEENPISWISWIWSNLSFLCILAQCTHFRINITDASRCYHTLCVFRFKMSIFKRGLQSKTHDCKSLLSGEDIWIKVLIQKRYTVHINAKPSLLAFHTKIKDWLKVDGICNHASLILDLLKMLLLALKTPSVW